MDDDLRVLVLWLERPGESPPLAPVEIPLGDRTPEEVLGSIVARGVRVRRSVVCRRRPA